MLIHQTEIPVGHLSLCHSQASLRIISPAVQILNVTPEACIVSKWTNGEEKSVHNYVSGLPWKQTWHKGRLLPGTALQMPKHRH